jgi:hypothetical protein
VKLRIVLGNIALLYPPTDMADDWRRMAEGTSKSKLVQHRFKNYKSVMETVDTSIFPIGSVCSLQIQADSAAFDQEARTGFNLGGVIVNTNRRLPVEVAYSLRDPQIRTRMETT